jgi:hypothetical protein
MCCHVLKGLSFNRYHTEPHKNSFRKNKYCKRLFRILMPITFLHSVKESDESRRGKWWFLNIESCIQPWDLLTPLRSQKSSSVVSRHGDPIQHRCARCNTAAKVTIDFNTYTISMKQHAESKSKLTSWRQNAGLGTGFHVSWCISSTLPNKYYNSTENSLHDSSVNKTDKERTVCVWFLAGLSLPHAYGADSASYGMRNAGFYPG